MGASCWIGCSGYVYDDWKGRLYPPDLPRERWFEAYADVFDTVELNTTFYRLPAPSTVDRWAAQAPPGFRFAVKLSRFGTHRKRLREPETWLPTFLERVERLGARLGPILVQLHPSWRADPDRLDQLLKAAPRRHRWAVELRDPRWLVDDVYEVLRAHGAALVIHDLIEDHPRIDTADWTYLRFHGPQAGRPYMGSYSSQALTAATRRIGDHLAAGRDVYAYFNNDVSGHAVDNARDLQRYVERVAAPAR